MRTKHPLTDAELRKQLIKFLQSRPGEAFTSYRLAEIFMPHAGTRIDSVAWQTIAVLLCNEEEVEHVAEGYRSK